MTFDHLLNEEQRRVRDQAREFVNSTPRQLILDMDEEKVRFPKEWLCETGRRNLLGARQPVRAMLLDACRSLVYATARAVDTGMDMNRVRRMVSETKKFVTESCQKVVHNAMQVAGGIGYTNVLPLERIYRDIRLASIWTGTNEVMATIVAHEWYREAAAARADRGERNYAADAPEADAVDEINYG